MPNWVPQSPMWLSLMTLWPRNRSTRHSASPITVERMWPTCIGLATFGAEKSIDERARPRDRRNAQPRVAHGRREPLDQPLVFDPQIDEARAGDFRRLAEVGQDRAGRPLRRPRRAAAGAGVCPAAWPSSPDNRRTSGLGCGGSIPAGRSDRRPVRPARAETLFQIGKNAHRGFSGTRLACPHKSSSA